MTRLATIASALAARVVLMAAAAAVLALDVPMAAQSGRGSDAAPRAGSIPRRPDGKPDLTGRWNGSAGPIAHTNILEEHAGGLGINAGKSLIIDPADGIIPYQPWALAERNRRREDANAYEDPVGHCEFYESGATIRSRGKSCSSETRSSSARRSTSRA